MSATPILYTSPGSCSLSPAIALNEAKIDYKAVIVNLGTHKTADGTDYYTISESGAVPLLSLPDGTPLPEGSAIIQWIADQAPASGLSPKKGTVEHYKFLATLNVISTEIHKGFSAHWFGAYGGDAGAFKDRSKANILKAVGRLDKRLEKQDYLEGSTFTVADGYLFTVLRWGYASWFSAGVGIHKDVDFSGFKNIEAWYKRVLARPGVQAALKAEGLPL